MLPNDPFMLLSVVNMKLRDEYEDLEDLCRSLDVCQEELCAKLEAVGYRYHPETRQFVR